MKCPFRKETTIITYPYGETQTTEIFRDCYEEDCPYYIAEEQDVTKYRRARCNNAE